jgi:hypothetical protein
MPTASNSSELIPQIDGDDSKVVHVVKVIGNSSIFRHQTTEYNFR